MNVDHEAERQQALLAALWRGEPALPPGLLAPGAARTQRGLRAYRAHAGAAAERALAASHPTLQQLLGEDSFAALARAFWQAQPPLQGDLGEFGAGLAGFIDASPSLAEEAYLGDCARLDWAVHQAERAADAPEAAPDLQALAEHDPAQLRLRLRPGTAVLVSTHPIVSMWEAHRSSADHRFDAVRAALQAGVGEAALVYRQGWRAVLQAVPAAQARFTQALWAGHSLGQALDSAEPDFDFQAWLVRALQQGWLLGVHAQAAQDNTQE